MNDFVDGITMAGRENEQDNSIELITSDHRSDPNTTQLNLRFPGPSITLSNTFSNIQTEAEHDRASLNALKVAFNSLQGYHNDQAKKLYSLQRKYNLLQEFVHNLHGNVDLGFLEQNYPQDQSSMAQAAGAYNESQEYGNAMLQRELIKNSQTLAMNKQEILARDDKLKEYDQKFKEYLKERERLNGDIEALSIVLDEKKAEIANKDRNIRELHEKIEHIQAELNSKYDLMKENEHFRQRIELYERSGILNERDPEKDELRVKLRNAQEECQRLHARCEEQNRTLDAKEKEITRLQSQCKQFEIENSILRSQRNEGNDMVDSGTNAELEKALELVKKQSNEIKALKNTAQTQNNVIQDLISKAKQPGFMKTKEIRDTKIAEGESGHYFGNEYKTDRQSAFTRLGPQNVDSRPVRSEILSTTPRYSIFPESGKAFGQRPVAVSSPQIKESIVPTGNQNIRPMMAKPSVPAVNVADCFVPSAENMYIDTSSKPHRFRASDSDLPRLAGHNEAVQRNNSSSLSPPNLLTRNRDQHAYVNHGTRPKTGDNLGVPSRMTQSEVIYGNLSPKRESMEDTTKYGSLTRSSFYPAANLNQRLENRPLNIPEVSATPKTIRLYDNEPDYENVFQTDETEEKRPDGLIMDNNRKIYENFADFRTSDRNVKDDKAFVVIPSRNDLGNFGYNPVQSTNVEQESDRVNSLKICPSCNREFSRLSTEEFQLHVYDCFDSNDDQPGTLQAPTNVSVEEDRTCPMCGATFPMTIPQETYEAHVLAHFGEEAPGVDRFEIINS